MKGVAIYQHPFVDVMKAFRVGEWKDAVKEGDVKPEFDKQLARTIFKINGSTLASNFIQIPSRHIKSLGLVGKWFYIQLRVLPGKQFSFHLDYVVDQAFVCRISCSNQFQDAKLTNSTNLQLPIKLQPGKWSTLALNAAHLVSTYFQPPSSLLLRSIQVCANCELKGIFTSDIQYRAATLPKQLQFRLRKDQDWFQLYEWLSIPDAPLPQDAPAPAPTVAKKPAPKATKKFLKSSKNKENQHENTTKQTHYAVQEIKQTPQAVFEKQEVHHEAHAPESPRGSPRKMPAAAIIHTPPRREADVDESAFALRPNPIMNVGAVLGGIQNCLQVRYLPCARLNDFILYASGNMLVSMNLVSSACRFFYHKRAFTRNFVITHDGKYIVAQCGERELTLWDYGSAQLLCSFVPPAFLAINGLDIDLENKQLLVFGKDASKRELLMIFDLTLMIREKRCQQISRQLSDFNIRSIRFTPEVPSKALISVGKENIRFWKVKASGHISGSTVALNGAGRDQIFSSYALQIGKQSSVAPVGDKKAMNALRIKNVLACTLSGKLFIVSYINKTLDRVVQAHAAAIHHISVASDKSFALTASEDGVVRLWRGNLDFAKSSVIFEQKVGSSVLSASIAPLNNGVTALLKNGALVHLDVESKRLKFKMRSHSQEILDFAATNSNIVTISRDRTIRVWCALVAPFQQKFEFVSPGDLPLCVATEQLYFAVGFESGYLRVFGLNDFKQHVESLAYQQVPILCCEYSPDLRMLAILKSNGRIVIYDIKDRAYEPIKAIENQVPHPQHYCLKFSPDARILAALSYSANSVLLYETLNFTQKAHIDLAGHMARGVYFSPNGMELAVLTVSNQVKYYRQSGTTADLAGDYCPLSVERGDVHSSAGLSLDKRSCQTMAISEKSHYMAVGCEDGSLRIYDYALRAAGCAQSATAEVQIFLAHMAGIRKLLFRKNRLYSLPEAAGGHNALFLWDFYGAGESEVDPYGEAAIDKEKPLIGKRPQMDRLQEEEELKAMPPPPVPLPRPSNPFETNLPPTLAISTGAPQRSRVVTDETRGAGGTFQRHVGRELPPPPQVASPAVSFGRQEVEQGQQAGLPIMATMPAPPRNIGQFGPNARLTARLAHSLSYSPRVSNLVWVPERDGECGKFIYSSQNTVIVEELNESKSQSYLRECLDPIHSIVVSRGLICAHTYEAEVEGFAVAFVWELATKKLINSYCASSRFIKSVELSPCGNLLLMLSADNDRETLVSVWAVQNGELLTKTFMLHEMTKVGFNPYLNTHQFSTLGPKQFLFWRINQSSNLEVQKPDFSPGQSALLETENFSTFCFTERIPCVDSVLLLIGLSNGTVWIYNTRTAAFAMSVAVHSSPFLQLDYHDGTVCAAFQGQGVLHFWEKRSDLRHDDLNFFKGPSADLHLDGNPVSLSLRDGQGFVGVSTGNVWFVSCKEKETVPIVNSHTASITHFDYRRLTPVNYDYADQAKKSTLASASRDGVVKVWSLGDFEQTTQFCVEHHQCSALALHPYNAYLVAGFTDGYLRFFEVTSLGKNLGRCLVASSVSMGTGAPQDYPVSLRFLPSGNEIYCATKMGVVQLLFVDKWSPLALRIHPLLHSNTPLLSLAMSPHEPYNKWLIGSRNGKVQLYNRQNANALAQEVFQPGEDVIFNFMDSFNLVEFIANGFAETRVTNKLDYHFRATALATAHNTVKEANEVSMAFSPLDAQLYVAGMKGSRYLFIRNFQIHQVIRKIELENPPIQIQFYPNSTLVLLARADGMVDFLDYTVSEETAERVRLGQGLALRVHSPNLSAVKVASGVLVTGNREGVIQVLEVARDLI